VYSYEDDRTKDEVATNLGQGRDVSSRPGLAPDEPAHDHVQDAEVHTRRYETEQQAGDESH